MENEIDIRKVTVTDAFWSKKQELVTKTVIPYQEKVLGDEIPGVEKSHAFANFRIAAGLEEGEFYGAVFQDSDVAKWLEGVAYSLSVYPDKTLESRADAVIEVIEKAQQEDGYLDTYFIIKEPDHKWQNLQECHELYCAGHMMEAGVAYYESTGKDRLLHVVKRLADCIDAHIGPEEGKIHGVPGHEEVEIGLLRLYRVTGNERYLNLARYFINERGQDPDWFAREKEKRGWIYFNMDPNDHNYAQTFAPVRDQQEARGHAVREMYLLTAMADLAQIDQDSSLYDTCRRLFFQITEQQMYLTGGLGQQAKWEGFTMKYDLPNDTAYAETCASIGLVFFAHRMLKLSIDRSYSDVMERALYNGVLSGMQLDGQKFFYVNPLEVNPGISGKMPGYTHVLTQRPSWFPCACCPPNVVRLLESLAKYAWDERKDETGKDLVVNHLYLGGVARFSHFSVKTESSYPWEGEIRYTFEDCDGEDAVFAFRIPGWAKEVRIFVNGKEQDSGQVKNGYFYVSAVFNNQDEICLQFAMPVRRMYCNPRVRANEGQAALMRGPLVYCFEGIDNGDAIQELRIPKEAEFSVSQETDKESRLNGMYVISFMGKRCVFPERKGNGLQDTNEKKEDEFRPSELLYSEEKPVLKDAPMKAIPYFAWGNRGENQMRVWMMEA